MRLVRRRFDKNGEGEVSLIPEVMEDMWHCYNLISINDFIKASTVRKIQMESSTGSKDSSRVRTSLTIQIEGVDFDTSSGVLRLKGRNVTENKYVKMGAYHTLDLELNQKFTLAKRQWDIIAIDRIEKACNPVHSADVAAVVMQEGLANVCLITEAMTLVRQRIEPPIPRKRKGDVSQYEKGMQKFFDQTMQAILNPNHINFSVIKCLIIASPGFVKDQFMEYVLAEAVKKDIKVILDNRSKFLLVHSSSGHVHALNEVLKDPTVSNRLSDTKATAEVKALEAFYAMMNDDPLRAYYGYKHVKRAAEKDAIDTLLISDELFRARTIMTRKKYVELVEEVQKSGGRIHIFSSAHVTGEQLGKLSGLAALLRYPMEEDDDDDDEGTEDNDIREMEEELERERDEREKQRAKIEQDFKESHNFDAGDEDDEDVMEDGNIQGDSEIFQLNSNQSGNHEDASEFYPQREVLNEKGKQKAIPVQNQQSQKGAGKNKPNSPPSSSASASSSSLTSGKTQNQNQNQSKTQTQTQQNKNQSQNQNIFKSPSSSSIQGNSKASTSPNSSSNNSGKANNNKANGSAATRPNSSSSSSSSTASGKAASKGKAKPKYDEDEDGDYADEYDDYYDNY